MALIDDMDGDYTFEEIDAEYLERLRVAAIHLRLSSPFDFIPLCDALDVIRNSLKSGDIEKARSAFDRIRGAGGPSNQYKSSEALAHDAVRAALVAGGRKGGQATGGKKAEAARRNGALRKARKAENHIQSADKQIISGNAPCAAPVERSGGVRTTE